MRKPVAALEGEVTAVTETVCVTPAVPSLLSLACKSEYMTKKRTRIPKMIARAL